MATKTTNNGPLGFPMPDLLAKAADEALKNIPKDVRERCKTTVTGADGKRIQVGGYLRREMAVKGMDFNDGERAEVSTITSAAVDHDSEVVQASGLDFDLIRQSPGRVALSHNYGIPCVGHCMWLKKSTTSDGLEAWKAKTKYSPRPEGYPKEQEWLPETTWFYVREGLLGSKSIGFIPTEIREVTPDDIRANPEWADAWCVIEKGTVLEYSVCAIGANPDALVEGAAKMRAKGISSKALTDALGLIIPGVDEPETKAPAPPIIEIKAFVKPETIQKAVEAEVEKSLAGLADRVKEQLVDRVYREMGRV